MNLQSSRRSKLTCAAILTLLCLSLQADSVVSRFPSPRMKHLPRRTLWVWERPEDMSAVNPTNTAIAWLDQTILVGPAIVSQPRRQTVVYPEGIARIAVVRIETRPGGHLDRNSEQQVVERLLQSATRPGIVAFQVDFDARRSERRFYTSVLEQLRARMPSNLPLSITALASWCSNDDWIANLPVDEAIPMLFRMEPERRHAPADVPEFRLREPKCLGSAGISTHEVWPEQLAGKRLYIFPDRGWSQDLAFLTQRERQ